MTLPQQIKQDEGLKLKPYICSAGRLTIGYGFNLDAGITEEVAKILFNISFQKANREAVQIMIDNSLPKNQLMQNILVQMCFQMGKAGVMGFKKMISALSRCDYKTAAKEMRNSKWHTDTPARCERLAREMEAIK